METGNCMNEKSLIVVGPVQNLGFYAYPQSSTTGRHFLSGIEWSLFRDPGPYQAA